MTLHEWFDLLEAFDPNEWGEISHLRATFSEEEREEDAEAEIVFRNTGVVPRRFPPAPGRPLNGHRIKAPLDYSRGPEKTWVYVWRAACA